MMRIELFRGGILKRKWFFRIVADNGQIIAQSEGYSRKIDCEATAFSLKKGLADAEIVEA